MLLVPVCLSLGLTAVSALENGTGTPSISGGVITSITIDDAGSGYTEVPVVTIHDPDGTGSGATATATISNGSVATVTVTSGGTGYSAQTEVFFTAAEGDLGQTPDDPSDVSNISVGAATAVITDGAVSSITVTDGGSGLVAAPSVLIIGTNGGSGATAEATIANGSVTSVAITNGGSGYEAGATIHFLPVPVDTSTAPPPPPHPYNPVLASIGDKTTDEDTSLTLTLSATDADGDTVTYSATVDSGDMTTSITGNNLQLVPGTDWYGDAIITVTADDNDDGSDSETFTVTVQSVNDLPTLDAIGSQTMEEDGLFSLSVNAIDSELDTMTYTAEVLSGNLTATFSEDSLSLTPQANWNGTGSIKVTANDGNGGTDTKTFSITVTAVNDAPELESIGTQSLDEDTTLSLNLSATDPDSDPVSYIAQVDSGNITATINGSTLLITPDADWNGAASVTITASDGNGGEDSQGFNISVGEVNDDPVLGAIGNQTLEEDGSLSVSLTSTDIEPDNATFSATVASGNLSATVNGNSLELTPDANWHGTASVTVTVSDGNGGEDSETFSVIVTSVNDNPDLDFIGGQTMEEDSTLSITLSGSDVDGDNVSFSAQVDSGDMTTSVSGNVLGIVPTADWNGTAEVTVTASDGNGGTTGETIVVTVTAVNDAPVLNSVGNQNTQEDTTFTITLSSSDAEGDTISYSAQVTSGNVTANLSDDSLELVPDSGWTGTAIIEVTADDGNGGIDTLTFELDVISATDPNPILDPIGDQSTNEDTTLTIQLSASGGDGGDLTFTVSTNSGDVTATVQQGVLTVVPDADWNGTASLTVTVQDGSGGSDSETFDVAVNNVNDAPVLSSIGAQTTLEDTPLTLTLASSDADSDAANFSASVVSGNVTATLTGDQLELIPAANWNGTAEITVVVHDGNGGTDTETIQLTVTPENDLPVLSAIGDQSTIEDTALTLPLEAVDGDGDNITFIVEVVFGNITATVSNDALTLTPDQDWNGSAELTFTASDGNGGTDTESFELTVTPFNDSPAITTIGNQTTQEDTPLTLTLAATDADGDNITFTAQVTDGDVTATLTGNYLELIPAQDWDGTATVSVTATDGNGGTTTQTFQLVVSDVLEALSLAQTGNQTTAEDSTLTLLLFATGGGGGTITYSATVDTDDVTATVSGNVVTITPDPDTHGNSTITLVAQDGSGGSDSKSFSLTVTPVNDHPSLTPIGDQDTDEDTDKTVPLTASDIDGDNVTFTANVQSGDVSASIVGNALELTPDPDWNGTAQVDVTVDDGNGGTATETFDFTVNAINDAPVLTQIQAQATDENTPLTLTLSATDVDGDAPSFTASVDSGNVTPTLTGNSLELIPDADWSGTATVTVAADDGKGGTDTTTFTLDVVGSPEPHPLLASAQTLVAGWQLSDWLGIFYFDDQTGWIYHNYAGWLFPSGGFSDSIWFHSTDHGWIWTDSATYPNFYSDTDSTWLYLDSTGATPVWWTWDSNTEEWGTE